MIAGLIVENFCSLERSRSVNINVASLKMREGHPANISALLLTTDGQQLFSADQDGNVIVWRLVSGHSRQVRLCARSLLYSPKALWRLCRHRLSLSQCELALVSGLPRLGLAPRSGRVCERLYG